MKEKERWMRLEKFPDYEISSFGRILSHKGRSLRLVAQHPNPDGYLITHLYNETGRHIVKTHILVGATFLPAPPLTYPPLELNHKDLNKANPCVDNLEWVTRSYNTKHAIIKKKEMLSATE